MDRKASAVWQGAFPDGKGLISTESNVLNQAQYSAKTRFENGIGTNPEELLAAAHAGCFAMALSAELGKEGIVPEKLEVTCTITLKKVGEGFEITKSSLDLSAKLNNDDKMKFDKAVEAAKNGCPVSKLYKTEISLSSKLV